MITAKWTLFDRMNKGLVVSADSALKVFKLKQGGGASAKPGKAMIIDV